MRSDHIKSFFSSFLTLSGDHKGKPFELFPWQAQFVDEFYREEDGRAAYSSGILEIPRKNGKTQLSAGLALAATAGLTGSPEPEVIAAASTRDQARILFNKCKKMIESSPDLKRSFNVLVSKHIECKHNGGLLKVVSSDAGGAHGLDITDAVCDELHLWPNFELWAALTTGSMARRTPRILGITTAGFDRESFLGQLRRQYMKYRHMHNNQWVERPKSRSLYVYYGPEEDEIYDHASWEAFCRHNPSHAMLSRQVFEDTVEMNTEAFIRQLYHNEWVSEKLGWMPIAAWHQSGTAEHQIKPGSSVVIGVDASLSDDSTAVVAVDLETFTVQIVGLWESKSEDEDFLIPLHEVKQAILKWNDQYDVREVVFDPYYVVSLMYELEVAGMNVVKLTTSNPAQMVPAVTDFYHAVLSGNLQHLADEDLTRHVLNCASKPTNKGVLVTKKGHRYKIDAAVAAIIAHHRAIHWSKTPGLRALDGEMYSL